MTNEQLLAQIEQLTAENNKLKAAKPSGHMKVSEKGALSVYGLGRFPVTLYKSQWNALIDRVEAIKQFITENNDKLKDKPDSKNSEPETEVKAV